MYDLYTQNRTTRQRRVAIHYKQLTFDLADLKFRVAPLFYIFLRWGIDFWGFFFKIVCFLYLKIQDGRRPA